MAFTKVTGPGINSTSNYETNHINSTGIITATKFVGDGSTLTGISAGISLSGSTDNTVCTVTGANAIQGESNVRIDSSGRLLIGHASAIDIGGGTLFQSQITGTNYDTSGFVQTRFEAGGSGPAIVLAHSRHGTKGSHTILQDGDEFGKIRFFGSDGTDFANNGAQIVAKVDGTPGDNDMPGRLEFHTTADGGTSATEKLRITSAGRVGINETSPDSMLHITANNDRSAITLENTYDNPDNVWELNPGISGVSNTGFCIHDVTNSANRFVINGSGNIGIGTDNPGKSLHISSSTPAIRLTDTDTEGPLHCDIESVSGDLYLDTGSIHRDVIISSVGLTNEIARFTGDGKVGINDSSPDSILSVKDSYIFSCAGGNATTGMQIGGYDAGANSYNPITVRASRIIFNISGTEKARIGSAGITTFTESVNAKSFVPTEGQLANRNVIINGDIGVAQRGTSFSSVGDSATTYTLDRWNLYVQNTTARFTVSQDSESPDGFAKSMKIDCTTADTSLASTDEVQLSQRIEGYNTTRFNKGTSSALQYTLSFWAKTNKTGTYIVRLLGRDNTISCVSASYTVSDSNWNKYVLTFPADTNTNRKDNADNGEALRVVWWLVAGSGVDNGTLQTAWVNSTDTGAATGQVNFADSTSNDFYLTGVQLEVGSYATPFEHRSYGEELARCQRYCYVATGPQNSTPSGNCGWYSGSDAHFNFKFPHAMRASPSFTASGTWRLNSPAGNGSNQTSGLTFIQVNDNYDGGTFALASPNTAASLGQACYLQFRGSGTKFTFDAEL